VLVVLAQAELRVHLVRLLAARLAEPSRVSCAALGHAHGGLEVLEVVGAFPQKAMRSGKVQ
jgi:hypothetical protein